MSKFKTIFAATITATLVSFTLSACSSNDDSDESSADIDTSAGVDGEGNPLITDGAATSPDGSSNTSSLAPGETLTPTTSVFDGSWASNCGQQIPTPNGEYQQATLIIDGDTYVSTISNFTDSDCSIPSIPSTAISDFSMQFPEGSVETPQGTASFVDITLEAFELDGVDALALALQTGLLGAVDQQFNIFVLADDGNLYFGVPALTAETRPTTLNTDFFFSPQ